MKPTPPPDAPERVDRPWRAFVGECTCPLSDILQHLARKVVSDVAEHRRDFPAVPLRLSYLREYAEGRDYTRDETSRVLNHLILAGVLQLGEDVEERPTAAPGPNWPKGREVSNG